MEKTMHYCAFVASENRYIDGIAADVSNELYTWYYDLKKRIIDHFDLNIGPEKLTILSLSVID